MANKIPKIIHYCWFGRGELPSLIKKCIKSWGKYLPDYEIKEWNEDNFNININEYVRQAYDAKKYAFVSDYARFYILYNYGGIYMDTDVEVIKTLDDLLNDEMFAGFEGKEGVNPGLILGSVKGTSLIREILDSYKNRIFINEDGSLNNTTVVKYTTDILIEHGLILNNKKQVIKNMVIYSSDYFCPLDYSNNKLEITKSTYTIHHYSESWHTPSEKFKTRIKQIFGEDFMKFLSKAKRIILSMKRRT